MAILLTTGGGFWIVPNSDNGLSQTFPANIPLDLAWSREPALSYFTSHENPITEADLLSLFVTAFQLDNSFSQLITSNGPHNRRHAKGFSLVTWH